MTVIPRDYNDNMSYNFLFGLLNFIIIRSMFNVEVCLMLLDGNNMMGVCSTDFFKEKFNAIDLLS